MLRKVRVLVVLTSPQDRDHLDIVTVEKEINKAKNEAASVSHIASNISIEYIKQPTITELQHKLNTPYNILLFFSHGDAEYIALTNENYRTEEMKLDLLDHMLRKQRQKALIIFSCCNTKNFADYVVKYKLAKCAIYMISNPKFMETLDYVSIFIRLIAQGHKFEYAHMQAKREFAQAEFIGDGDCHISIPQAWSASVYGKIGNLYVKCVDCCSIAFSCCICSCILLLFCLFFAIVYYYFPGSAWELLQFVALFLLLPILCIGCYVQVKYQQFREPLYKLESIVVK